jgi:hypothetical protein
VIELATGRSLAVSAARDDTRFFVFPAFKVADAKHVLRMSRSSPVAIEPDLKIVDVQKHVPPKIDNSV